MRRNPLAKLKRSFAVTACTSAVLIGSPALLGSRLFAADAEQKKITFEDHIKPIFREHCTTCHSESDKESDLALDTYTGTMSGGSSGDVIKSGDADGSRLFALVMHAEGPYMPPDEDPIAKEKIALLKTWIEQGMPENSGSKIRKVSGATTAMLTSASIGKPDGPPPLPEALLKQPVLETPRSSAISAMAASPWAPLLAIGGQEQVVLYHTESQELLGVIPFPEGEPQSLTFTRDGKQILIGGGRHSHSGCAVLVDIASGQRLAKVGDELDVVLTADISPDKTRIALAGPQKIIRIFDTLTGEVVHSLKKHTDWIFAVRYSPDGILLASGDRSSGLVLWEADSGLLYGELKGHKDAIRDVDFRADSNVLVSASMDGTLKTWDMFESKQLKSWNGHGGGVTSVAYTQDGNIATSGRDRNIKLWDGNGRLKTEYKGLNEAALEVAITGDGKQIAGGDWNGKALLWSAADAKTAHPVLPNPPSIESRLTTAEQLTQQLKGQLAAAEATNSQAAAAAKKFSNENATLQKQLTDQSRLTTASETTARKLTSESANVKTEIAALEAKLATLRALDTELTSTIAQNEATRTTLAASSKQLTTSITSLAPKLDAAAKQAAAAATKLAEAQAAFDAANQQLAQATADKAALEKRAADLKAKAKASQAEIAKTATELAAEQEKLQSQVTQAESAAETAAAIAEQLEALNKKLAAAQAASDQADKKKSLLGQKAAQLKNKLTTAEQSGAEAAEALKLFQSIYKAK